jgi:hypothetical protein
MPGPVVTIPPFGVSDAFNQRVVGVITTNTRVKGSTGMVGTALDQLLFGGAPSVYGLWTVPNTRVAVGGVPTVGRSSQGLALMPTATGPVVTGPLLVSQGDRKIRNT